MNLFAPRRRDVLSELKVPEEEFVHLDAADETLMPSEPEQDTPVSPMNEIATSLVELDIAEALKADFPPPEEPVAFPAPLSQRHLETIDRMVTHLKADEKRLEQQIREARTQLADTRLARHGYERNGTDLRRGISALIRNDTRRTAPRRSRGGLPDPEEPTAVDDMVENRIAVLKPRGRRQLHTGGATTVTPIRQPAAVASGTDSAFNGL